jgi:PAS domain S-box-containing protein
MAVVGALVAERLKARLFRPPAFGDYLLALAFVAAAVLLRAGVHQFLPHGPFFIILFPAVVLAGVVCGTAPAVVAAIAGGAAIAGLFVGPAVLTWPPFNSGQIAALTFVPACAVVLWACTALRRFAANAAQAEARLAEVFRQIPGAAAILEAPNGRLLLRSVQSDAVLGQRERQLAGSNGLADYGGLHQDGRRFAADDYPIVRALKLGEVVGGEQFRYRRPDGQMADLEVYAGPVRNAAGAIVAAVGMAFDVTEKVETVRKLRESEALHRATAERLRAAIDAGALGLWELDLDRQRFWLDAAAAAMLGLPAEPIEIARTDMVQFVDPTDWERASKVFAEASDAQAISTGVRYADELRMRTAQNAPRWIVSHGALLADTRKVAGVMRDVTQRREREDALHAALAARDVLMREADHRIKNSLQLVVALLGLQLRRVADRDAKAALTAAITRVNAVADAHLALQESPDLRSIQVGRMLADLCARIGSLNPAVATTHDTDVGLWADAEQAIPLGLIASELLTNALRHAFPAGGPGTVALALAVESGTLAMTVTDDGVGMPATPTRSGLGTSVIDTLARQIDATVTRRSTPGEGTTVHVHLRLTSTQDATVALCSGDDVAQR